MTQWVQLTSGQAIAECCWVVGQIIPLFTKDLEENGLKVHLLDALPGAHSGTYKSVLFALEGEKLPSSVLTSWEGSILWIGKSTFRPTNKRKNWYIGLQSLISPKTYQWDEKELQFESLNASGPGGQHVNKNKTAIRVTHLPTGLSTIAQEERSLSLNRKLALVRLAQIFQQENQQEKEQSEQMRWKKHHQLERGNPVRTYEGKNFRLLRILEP